jgi:hypothetical protein
MLEVASLNISELPEPIKLELYQMSEFADGSASILEGVVLEIRMVDFLRPDPGDTIAGSYVRVNPNPFNEYMVIDFGLKTASKINFSIFNILGMRVHHLPDTDYPEGEHQIRLYGLDFTKGMYFLNFEIRNMEVQGSKLFKLISIR